jgi:hypothetical protein
MSWHYKLMGEEFGPVTAKELKQAAEAGTISPDTLVRKVGLDDWVTADRVNGLFTQNPTAAKDEPQSSIQTDSQTTKADVGPKIKFTCSNCQKQYSVGSDMAGADTTCIDCDRPLRVPGVHKGEHEAPRSHAPVQAKPNSFLCTFGDAFSAAQKSIRNLSYKVDSLDRQNGLITFKTGMSAKSWAGQEMSLMLIDNGDGSIEVSITGRRNQTGVVIQLADWGEADSIVAQILGEMREFVTPTMPQETHGVNYTAIGFLVIFGVAACIAVIVMLTTFLINLL